MGEECLCLCVNRDVCVCGCLCVCADVVVILKPIALNEFFYGVATISRLLEILGLLQNIISFIGLFCKRNL